jgi:hypothetical protein
MIYNLKLLGFESVNNNCVNSVKLLQTVFTTQTCINSFNIAIDPGEVCACCMQMLHLLKGKKEKKEKEKRKET